MSAARTPPPVAYGGRLINPAIAELAELAAWVCWRHVFDPDKQRWFKKPVQPNGRAASVTDPRSWTSFDACWTAAFVKGIAHGIGRVVVDGEGLVGIDLDDAVALDGSIEPWANEVIQSVSTFWERSPSGNGMHGWCHATWPVTGCKRPFEVYASKHYLTVTGDHLDGTPATINRVDLMPLWHRHFEGRHQATTGSATITCGDTKPLSATELARILSRYPQIRKAVAKTDQTLSDRDWAICCAAERLGLAQELAWSIVKAVRPDDKANFTSYRESTLKKAYGHG